LKKNTGKEEMRARDLFCYVDWFIYETRSRRWLWTLMCLKCPGLYDVHGEEFEKCTPIMKKAGKGRKNHQSA
jgi:ribonucleoside-diphosphate reductase alpha chain